MDTKNTAHRWMKTVAVGAAGLIAGGVLAGTLTAQADESNGGASSTDGYGRPGMPGGPTRSTDPSQPQRNDESLLSGSTAAKVKAAALAKYPGATVVRIETDSDGVYEAHLTKSDGTPVTVEVDRSFAVTGEEQMGGPGGPGGMPGPGGIGGPGGMPGPGGMGGNGPGTTGGQGTDQSSGYGT